MSLSKPSLPLALAAVVLALGAVASSGATHVASSGIKIALSSGPDSVDPCQTAKQNISEILSNNITESLTRVDPFTGAVGPMLATSWKQTSPRSWRFQLRKGVTFSNGTPFNSAAVVSWMKRVLNPKPQCYVRGYVLPDNSVTSVVAAGPSAVIFKTATPQPILPRYLSLVDISIPPAKATDVITNPVGTGPYVMGAYKIGQSLTVTRNPHYWGKAPSLASVEYVFRSESSVRSAMARTHEVDMAMDLGPQSSGDEGTITFLISNVFDFHIDALTPPLNDLRVRQAINYAIDRKTLIKTVWNGAGQPAYELPFPSLQGYNPSVKWPYDPEKAKALIAAAKADGVPVDNKIEIASEVGMVGSNGSEIQDTIAAMLSAVGLNAVGTTVDQPTRQNLIEEPQTASSPHEPPTLAAQPSSNNLGDAILFDEAKFVCGTVQTIICDKKLTAMIKRAGSAQGGKRIRLLQNIEMYVHDHVVTWLPVAYLTETIAISNPRLKYKPTPDTFEKLELATITLKG